MVWVATEDFEYAPDASDINGKTGGSGWSAAWSGSTAFDSDDTTPAVGTYSCLGTGATTVISRTLTIAVTAGVVQFVIRKNTNSANTATTFRLKEGSTLRVYGAYHYDGGIEIGGATWEVLLASPSINTWYWVQVEIDQPNGRFRARIGTSEAAVQAASWTAYVGYLGGGTFNNIDTIALSHDVSAYSAWWDDIKSGGGETTTPVITQSTLLLMGVG